jgi:osmotically-inducible protein OsmY
MSATTDAIARAIEETAGLILAVREDEAGVVLSGIVDTEAERDAALDIAREMSDGAAIVDAMEILGDLPDDIGEDEDSDVVSDDSLEPGDFTDQRIMRSAEEAAGPSTSFEDDEVSDGDEVYVPPIDPVGTQTEVIGGTQLSSMDSIEVERSSDGQLGDEAIREAVLRELREDAATTSLNLDVVVVAGVVRLGGTVADIEDAEAAEEVAARVPGVVEVEERLDVEALDR